VQVTAKADYAVRACAELAAAEAGPTGPHVQAERIAASQEIPPKFLDTILLNLKRSGIVRSQRGAEGGWRLARPAGEISVADVVRAVDGPLAAVRGYLPDALEYEGAAEHLTAVWVALRAAMRSVLERVTLDDLVAGQLPVDIVEMVEDPAAWTSRWT
jgi:Rrf2 family protein